MRPEKRRTLWQNLVLCWIDRIAVISVRGIFTLEVRVRVRKFSNKFHKSVLSLRQSRPHLRLFVRTSFLYSYWYWASWSHRLNVTDKETRSHFLREKLPSELLPQIVATEAESPPCSIEMCSKMIRTKSVWWLQFPNLLCSPRLAVFPYPSDNSCARTNGVCTNSPISFRYKMPYLLHFGAWLRHFTPNLFASLLRPGMITLGRRSKQPNSNCRSKFVLRHLACDSLTYNPASTWNALNFGWCPLHFRVPHVHVRIPRYPPRCSCAIGTSANNFK